jgi:hypothetical protein
MDGLYEADYIQGWYAAEGLRAVGRQACTEPTITTFVHMLRAPEARNQTWALYILSRWGAEDVSWLGEAGEALKPTKRAAVALGNIAVPDKGLLKALRALCEEMKTLAVDAKDEPNRRGLVEALQEAIGLIGCDWQWNRV